VYYNKFIRNNLAVFRRMTPGAKQNAENGLFVFKTIDE